MDDAPPDSLRRSSLQDDLENSIKRLEEDEGELGQRLLSLGSGPVAIRGAISGSLALDADGAAILIVALPSLDPKHAPQIADELDRVAQLSDSGLVQTAKDPLTLDELRSRHTKFFDLDASRSLKLNSDQAAIVVLGDDPSVETWKALLIELGPQLRAVYRVSNGDMTQMQPPTQLLSPGTMPWLAKLPLPIWLALFAILIGVSLILYSIVQATQPDLPPPATSAPTNQTPLRDVAADVLPDATNNQWIGQRRIVTTSSNRLIAVLSTPTGIQIASDWENLGRAWTIEATLPEIDAESFSVAVDSTDNLHLAYSDGSEIAYSLIRATKKGFVVGDQLVLTGRSTSPVVDIGWDPKRESVHVVWAEQSKAGEAPHWAQLSVRDRRTKLVDSAALAPAGEDIPVLVNVAVSEDAQVLATYRRGDSVSGWFSRLGDPRGANATSWSSEESLPTTDGIGAASVAFDDRGAAHAILRDSTTNRLLYLRRTKRDGWSSGETAVDADAIEQIDFPTVSVDSASRLIYVFFQTNEFNPAGDVVFAIRDPATGWEGPYPVSPKVPEGALYPNSIEMVDGQPIVLWTKGGAAPVVQAARVIVP
jgi:hypothetical protein